MEIKRCTLNNFFLLFLFSKKSRGLATMTYNCCKVFLNEGQQTFIFTNEHTESNCLIKEMSEKCSLTCLEKKVRGESNL